MQRFALVGGFAAAGLVLAVDRAQRAVVVGTSFFDAPPTYARIAADVRRLVPPGEVLFTDDPFVTEILLDARWAITSYRPGLRSRQEVMARDEERFDLVDLAPGSANGLYLWRLR